MNITIVSFILVAAAAGTALLAFSAFVPYLTTSASAQQETAKSNANTTGTSEAAAVSVGMGNLTVSYNQFYPQELTINTGESISFLNPTPELHSVIFDFSNGTIFSDIILPFTLTGNPQFELQEPFNTGEPMVETDGNGSQTLITVNKLVFVPSTVDKSGNPNYLNGTEVSYTMTGEENVISSGILMPTQEELDAMFMAAFPEEMMAEESSQNTTATDGTEEEMYEPVTQDVNRFTVTFEQRGTYEFFCPFHPAMYGTVTVS
jgi:plastocyanin